MPKTVMIVEDNELNMKLFNDLLESRGYSIIQTRNGMEAIGLARALIRRPKVLFLDEPTAHFDVRSEAEFLDRLKALGEENLTIMISTHRLSLLSFVDRILLFERGRLIADGPRDKVIAMLRGGPTKVAEPVTPVKGVKTVA